MKPPLQLETYFYTKIYIDAGHPDGVSKDETTDVVVNTKTTIKQNIEYPDKWMVILNINTKTRDDKPIPYNIDIEVVGMFEIMSNLEAAKKEAMIRVNGASILYSAAREFILTITGRGPWNAWNLPTISFLNMKKDEEPANKE